LKDIGNCYFRDDGRSLLKLLGQICERRREKYAYIHDKPKEVCVYFLSLKEKPPTNDIDVSDHILENKTWKINSIGNSFKEYQYEWQMK
jgi:hypothetical protein